MKSDNWILKRTRACQRSELADGDCYFAAQAPWAVRIESRQRGVLHPQPVSPVLLALVLTLCCGLSDVFAQHPVEPNHGGPNHGGPGHVHSPPSAPPLALPAQSANVEQFLADFAPYTGVLDLMAVQDDGRFKTFRTVAEQLVTTMHGKNRLRAEVLTNKELADRPATFTVLDMLFRWRLYENERIVWIKNKPFRQRLADQLRTSITAEEHDHVLAGYISPAFLQRPAVADALNELQADIMHTRKHVEQLRAAEMASNPGMLLEFKGLIPPPDGDRATPWFSVLALLETRVPTRSAGNPAYAEQLDQLRSAWNALQMNWMRDGDQAGKAAASFTLKAGELRPDIYPALNARQTENLYVKWGKFTWVWGIYFVSAVFLLMAAVNGWSLALRIGVAVFTVAFVLHTIGMTMRWFISGRIPIATQFESMLAAGWFTGVVALLMHLWPGFWARLRERSAHGWGIAAAVAICALVGFAAADLRTRHFTIGVPGPEMIALGVAAGVLTFTALAALTIFVWPRANIASPQLALPGGMMAGGLMAGTTPEHLTDARPTQGASAALNRAEAIQKKSVALRGPLVLLGSAVACMIALAFGHFMPAEVGADIRSIAPILNDALLYIHVNVIILSYGLITVAAVLGGLYLSIAAWQRLRGHAVAATTRDVLDSSSMLLLHLSFLTLWTGIVLGAVWADYSWGRPWGWDPKEVFALNTWIILLMLVHVRLKLSANKRALWTAVLSIIAFAVMMFNYVWVNFVIPGLHSYA